MFLKIFFLNIILILIFSSLCAQSGTSSSLYLKNKLNEVKKLEETFNDSCIIVGEEVLLNSIDKNSIEKVELIEFLGTAYRNFGFNQKGTEKFHEALLISEKISNKSHIAYNNRMLGDAYRSAMLYNKSIDYIQKSLDLYISIYDSNNLAITFNNLAGVYFELFNSTDTLNITKRNEYKNLLFSSIYKAINIGTKISSNKIKCSSYNVLGAFYNYNRMPDSSFYYYNLAIDLCNDENIYTFYPELLIGKAHLLIKVKRFKDAIIYAQKVYDFLGKNIAPGFKVEYFRIKYDCYKELGLNQKALLTLDSLYKFQIILFDKTLKMNAKIVQSYYENQRNLIEMQHTKQNITYSIIFVTIVLILLSIIIFILRKSNKEHHKINKELELSNQTKDKFFSIIAHDLKGPIGTFTQITKLLYEKYNSFSENEKMECLKIISNTSNNIYSLLENLLQWSISQRGKIPYNPTSINLTDVTNEIIIILKPTSDNKEIELINLIPKEFTLIADYNMINIIIRNLISNSIKFTNNGGKIEIGIKTHKINELNTSCIFVKDNGIGMNEGIREKLFRIDNHHLTFGTNDEQGTGLGLILCREFVEKHGGKIWVESEEGKGSTFYFTLA